MTQPSRETVQDLLPYLEWIDIFHEIRFKEIIRVPVDIGDYTLKTYFPDIGFLYWYSHREKQMQKITFCMKEYQLLQNPLIKSTLGELLNSVNTADEALPWYYVFRIKGKKIRDAIRINLKKPLDRTTMLPKGFQLSHGFMCHNDMTNLQRIQQYLDEKRTIRLITTLPKRENHLKLYNHLTESMICIRGTIPSELVEICKKFGYHDKTYFEGSE